MDTKTISVPLLDLKPQFAVLRAEIMAEIQRVVESQYFILGPEVASFEAEVAAYCGVRHAIGCASGSDALLLALMAAGVGPGDKVLTTPYSFFATAGSISRLNARPVFVDVEPSTFNIDAQMAAARLESDPSIKAVIPVHLFGACADLDPILAAARPGVAVIEDAAQSIGAEYRGRRCGDLATMACFSFFPSKNLGAFGDAGMLTTGDTELARRLSSLRVHGSTEKYRHDEVGFNSRLDALQAAILRVKLRHLDAWSDLRGRNAELYTAAFQQRAVPVVLPCPAPYQTRHVWNQFVIRCPRRDQLRQHLAGRGIGSEVYYPRPLHLQPCFLPLGYREGDFPVSEQLARETLALPVYPELTVEQIEYVVDAIAGFYA